MHPRYRIEHKWPTKPAPRRLEIVRLELPDSDPAPRPWGWIAAVVIAMAVFIGAGAWALWRSL